MYLLPNVSHLYSHPSLYPKEQYPYSALSLCIYILFCSQPSVTASLHILLHSHPSLSLFSPVSLPSLKLRWRSTAGGSMRYFSAGSKRRMDDDQNFLRKQCRKSSGLPKFRTFWMRTTAQTLEVAYHVQRFKLKKGKDARLSAGISDLWTSKSKEEVLRSLNVFGSNTRWKAEVLPAE